MGSRRVTAGGSWRQNCGRGACQNWNAVITWGDMCAHERDLNKQTVAEMASHELLNHRGGGLQTAREGAGGDM